MTAVKPETGSSLTGYWGSDNSQHVNFIGLDGHVHELYILPGAGWVDNDLTELATAQSPPVQPAVQSGLSGFWQSDDSVHVFYFGAGTDSHVYQLRIFPGGPGWVWEDLTSLADGIVPEVSRALNGYWGTDNSQHVNYIGRCVHSTLPSVSCAGFDRARASWGPQGPSRTNICSTRKSGRLCVPVMVA